MKYVSIVSGIFLLAAAFFSWGFMAAEFNKFPRPFIKKTMDEVEAFVRGGEANRKTIREKIANDAGLRPERALVGLHMQDGRKYEALEAGGLRQRRSSPLIFRASGKAVPPGYLLIWGAFDFESHLHGGILLDHKCRVLHSWMPDEKAIRETVEYYNESLAEKGEEVPYKSPKVRFPHGLKVFPDGSLLFNDGDPGNGMQKIDFCSNNLWVKLGKFNHTIAGGKANSGLWAIDRHDFFHKLDAETGETKRVINIYDILASNPDVGILPIRRDCIHGEWLESPWHFNDAEPLSASLAGDFPAFREGDLLLSMRSLNAVMVVDPNTLEIKWWRAGAFHRQHDPDWQADGRITVYDNNIRASYDRRKCGCSKRFSRIVSLDPESFRAEVVYEGSRDRFYSKIRGKHQVLPDGSILITSSMQGRVMLVNAAGKTVFEFVNRYDRKNSLLVSEAVWLPPDFFDFSVEEKSCTAPEKRKSRQTAGSASAQEGFHYAASGLELKKSLESLQPVPEGRQLSFVADSFLALKGWNAPERSFVWSKGKAASLFFKLPGQFAESGGRVELLAHTLGRQRIRAYFNGHLIRAFEEDLDEPVWLSFSLPSDAANKDKANRLRLEFPDARLPDSPDSRILALALYSAKFCREGKTQ